MRIVRFSHGDADCSNLAIVASANNAFCGMDCMNVQREEWLEMFEAYGRLKLKSI